MSKPGRMTISVPQDLKDRMEEVDEPVSWSAVACQAFEQRLAEYIKKKGARDMEDVINRLRASKRKTVGKYFDQGYAEGEAWAKDYAEADDLERLEDFHEKCVSEAGSFENWLEIEKMAPWSSSSLISAAIKGGDEEIISSGFFAEGLFDHSRLGDFDYLLGFVEGALNIWHRVKSQL